MKKLLFVLLMTALLSSNVFAQNQTHTTADLPRIAVYVTGENAPQETRNALGTFILDALVNSEHHTRYRAIERAENFLDAIEMEHIRQRSGEIADDQISALGRQAGAQFLCVANITGALDGFQVSARIIDVETAEIIASGVASSPLRTLDDLKIVSAAVVYRMIGVRVRTDQNFELLTEQEQTALEQSIQQTIEQTMTQSSWRNRRSFWIGLGIDAVGLGVLTYGIIEHNNASNHRAKHNYRDAEDAESRRNTAYIVGAGLLLTGISIQLFF